MTSRAPVTPIILGINIEIATSDHFGHYVVLSYLLRETFCKIIAVIATSVELFFLQEIFSSSRRGIGSHVLAILI